LLLGLLGLSAALRASAVCRSKALAWPRQGSWSSATHLPGRAAASCGCCCFAVLHSSWAQLAIWDEYSTLIAVFYYW